MTVDSEDIYPVEIKAGEITEYAWRHSSGMAAKGGSDFYQKQLLMGVLERHVWDNKQGKTSDLRGRSFYVSVSEDGCSVRVVEE